MSDVPVEYDASELSRIAGALTVLQGILSGKTEAQACQDAGVTPATFQLWWQREDVRKAVAQALNGAEMKSYAQIMSEMPKMLEHQMGMAKGREGVANRDSTLAFQATLKAYELLARLNQPKVVPAAAVDGEDKVPEAEFRPSFMKGAVMIAPKSAPIEGNFNRVEAGEQQPASPDNLVGVGIKPDEVAASIPGSQESGPAPAEGVQDEPPAGA
jgi:hypothetical protein